MFCPNCGTKLPDRSRFCQVCGAPQVTQPQSTSSVEIPIPERKKHSVLSIGLIVAGVVFLIILALAIIGYMVSPNNSPESESTEPSSYGVGDTAKAESYHLTVESASVIESNNMFIQPDDGYEYFEVVMVVENISDKDLSVSSVFDFEAYVDGFTIDQEFFLSDSTSADSIDGTAAPDKMVRGSLCYELPVDWSELEIQVSIGYGSKNETIILICNENATDTHSNNQSSSTGNNHTDNPGADISTPSYNASNSTDSEREILLDGIETEYTAYSSVLYAVGRALELECDFEELSEKNLSPLLSYGDLWDTGYIYLDINNDGVDELLIGDMEYPSGQLIAMYRMDGETATLVLNGQERNMYVLCSDGVIVNAGSSGADSSYQIEYVLSDFGLISAPYGTEKDFYSLTDEYYPEYKSIASFYIG